MPVLSALSHVTRAGDLLVSHVGALLAVPNAAGETIVYASTGHDGAVTAWRMAGSGLVPLGSTAYRHGSGAGGTPGLAVIDTADGGQALVAGGGASGGLSLIPLTAGGGFGTARMLGTTGFAGDLVDPLVVTTAAGEEIVLGGIAAGSGIGRVYLTAADGIARSDLTPDSGATHAERVTALAHLTLSGMQWVVSASTLNPGLTAFRLASDGRLSPAAHLGAAEGLWISAPTALTAAVVAGATYLVVAAAGSDSLSVVEIGADGRMVPRAHLLDDLDSRFGGVAALAVVAHQGLTYVIAGGADDGISVFLLLPGGGLLAEAHLADTAATGLANVSAIAAGSTAAGIAIAVASGAEAGLTRLVFDPGPAGTTLTAGQVGATLTGTAGRDLIRGGAGADSLNGGAGDDVILDGAGADRMTGGAGADLFVLARDGAADMIVGFVAGEDRLNLSAWPALRSLRQLTFTARADGLEILYGTERLVLLSADGRPIDPALLSAADVIGGTVLPVVPDVPAPNPNEPEIDPPRVEVPAVPTDSPDTLRGGTVGDTIRGRGGNDRIFGDAGGDSLWGEAGDDRLYGGAGDDQVAGGSGRDVVSGGNGDDSLRGEDGDDRLTGGAGRDRIEGGAGHDRLSGGSGDDLLRGGGGRDRLRGQGGNDGLWGGGGRDTLSGGSGQDSAWGDGGSDRIAGAGGNDALSGGGGHDRIAGGAGRDRIVGGGGRDLLQGNAGRDVLAGGGGDDRLDGGADRDRIAGEGGRDVLAGGAGADVFVFGNRDGADRITDCGWGADRILLDPGLWGGDDLTPRQIVARFGDALPGGDMVLAFGDGDRLVIEGIGDPGSLARILDLG